MEYFTRNRVCTPLDCGAHGTCVDGFCVCDNSPARGFWAGTSCDACSSMHTGADCKTVKPVAGRTCADIKLVDPTKASGSYVVDPDGDTNTPPIATYCDMDTDGGGYARLLQTVWDWTSQSELLQTNWADTYANTVGNIGATSAYRLAVRDWEAASTDESHLLRVQFRKKDGTSCDPLTWKVSGFHWDVASTGATLSSSTITQPWNILYAGNSFVASDSTAGGNRCPRDYGASPWTYNHCCHTCPTFKGSYWSDSPHPMINEGQVKNKADINGKLVADACGGAELEISRGYIGANVFEYLARATADQNLVKCTPGCGDHGTCVAGTCVCDKETDLGFWDGASCDQCAAGYGTSTCTVKCPTCANGSCQGGTTGNGRCGCPRDQLEGFWDGPTCSECMVGYTGTNCATPTITCQNDFDVGNKDLEALTELYNDCAGDNWTNNSGWKVGAPCNADGATSNWHGVSCQNGRVRILLLPNNNLKCAFPESLKMMCILQELDLEGNSITGGLPAWFGTSFPHFKSLNVGKNQMSGPLPDTLGNIEHLQFFLVNNNNFSGSIPSDLGIVSLKYIYLQGNSFSGPIAAFFEKLPELRHLDVSDTNIEGAVATKYASLVTVRRHLMDSDMSNPEDLPAAVVRGNRRLEGSSSRKLQLSGTSFMAQNTQLSGCLDSSYKQVSYPVDVTGSSNLHCQNEASGCSAPCWQSVKVDPKSYGYQCYCLSNTVPAEYSSSSVPTYGKDHSQCTTACSTADCNYDCIRTGAPGDSLNTTLGAATAIAANHALVAVVLVLMTMWAF
eukprot:GFYU01003402.1.p1 GENE.GFYU01003402.1~~GFYU01003402.1.p1  ORF type:complete len:914 (-),score=267.08 GFYU01003402.1:51-2420(-)